MRATIETHESSRTLPPIKVMIALGGEDLSIKVNHRGGLKLILESVGELQEVHVTSKRAKGVIRWTSMSQFFTPRIETKVAQLFFFLQQSVLIIFTFFVIKRFVFQ